MDAAKAIEAAANAFEWRAAELAARAVEVRRLDDAASAYTLVVLEHPDGRIALVAVDAQGMRMQSAALPAGSSHPLIDEERALAAASAAVSVSPAARAELVWKACAVSMSPLYPFWRISDGAINLFIDQQGRVARDLEKPQRG